MANNPDRDNETMTDFLPVQGMLRYVVEQSPKDRDGVVNLTRTLQQYQWSATDNKLDWYDVPSVDYVESVKPQDLTQQDSKDTPNIVPSANVA